MLPAVESPSPLALSQAVAAAVTYMDYRYSLTQHHGVAHWTWTCAQVEWTQVGSRSIYRCRLHTETRRGCFGGRAPELQFDVQVDAETQEILGFSETGWDWRSHR